MTERFRQAAASEAFEQLQSEEHDRVWDLVYSELRFRASTRPEAWPGFVEPEGSVAWSVAPLFDDFATRFIEAEISLAGHLAAAIDLLLGEDTYAIGLDWQHPGYRFFPRLSAPPTRQNSWPIPVLPDGDYFLYVAADLRFGWLTHPWEQSVCCYGGLTEEMGKHLEALGLPIIRESGSPR